MHTDDEQYGVDDQRTVLEGKVKKIDEQIALLNDLKNQYLVRLKSLPQSALHQPSSPQSPEEKIVLFKNYFRGRDDVYAKLWINEKD